MFPYSRIYPPLAQAALDLPIFDTYRLIDPRYHRVYDCDHDTGDLIEMPGMCFDIWHRHAPCINCTSKTCRAMHKEMAKVEYLDGQVVLVICVPVEVQGRLFSLELAKDVTDSFMVADAVNDDNTEITTMIARFNDMATKDAFTGLYNKNYINNHIDDIIEEHLFSPERQFSVNPLFVLCDIDDFKSVNDTYGHSVGDDVILYVTKHIFRPVEDYGGWTGRFGGDEFLLCLPGISDEDARAFCHSMFRSIEDYTFTTSTTTFSISISAGVTRLHADDTRLTLINRVDRAMYAAKETPEHWVEDL